MAGPVWYALAVCRAVFLVLSLMVAGAIASAIMIILYPFLLCFDKRWGAGHRISCKAAELAARLFIGSVEFRGLENVPQPFERIVIVCNHQSTLDIFLCAYLGRLPFTVIFKKELLFYPGLGLALWLSRYLYVDRHDKDSGRKLLRDCAERINNGGSVFFFPEGTRKIDGSTGPLGPFKPGAFKLASETNAILLPFTISGARKMFPSRGIPRLFSGNPVITIHPPITTAGKTVEELSELARTAIASGLRPIDDLPVVSAPSSSHQKAQ